GVCSIADLDLLFPLFILLFVLFCLVHHLFDIGFCQLCRGGDGHLLLFTGPEILCRYIQDTRCIDIERDFNLGDTPWCRGNADEIKLPEAHVVCCHGAFPLEHVDGDGGLEIRCRGEDLALLRRDRGVPINQRCPHPPESLEAKSQGRNIQEHHVRDLAAEDRSLYRGTGGNAFHWIDPPLYLPAHVVLDEFLDYGHPGRPADKDHFLDIVLGQVCIFQCLFERLDAPPGDRFDQLFEFRPGQFHGEVFWACLRSGDIGHVDLGLQHGGELDFCFFRRFLYPVDRHLVSPEIDPLEFLELVGNPFKDCIVHVRAAQLGIAGGGEDRKRSATELHDRHIECAAAKIKNKDLVLPAAVEAVRHRCCRGLIDQPDYIEPRNLACIFCCCPLVVVEVGGNRDHGLGHRFPKECFRIPFYLLQEECGNLLGRVFLAINPVDMI